MNIMNEPVSDSTENQSIPTQGASSRKSQREALICAILMVIILATAAYLRFAGIRTWDENQHLHPDERFLTMVETDISPVSSLGEYFDTANSSLNPQNRGHSFFVYGDLPVIFVRYLAEATGETGYDEVNILGREVSAVADLITIFLIYLIGSKLYNRRVGVLASAFSAVMVLQIQLSHFFAVDTFANLFTTLSIYIAVLIYKRKHVLLDAGTESEGENLDSENSFWLQISRDWEGVGLYLLFGLALGCAMASKINTVALAIVLPIAVIAWYCEAAPEERQRWFTPLIRNVVIAAVVAFLAFRVFQPYAFSGPGFFNIGLNSKWVDNLIELQGQSNGTADFPPALQWARRGHTFALKNLVLYGMGLPLGILVWAGFLWMAWRMIKGEWTKHLILWGWVLVYFGWQSLGWNPMMRYMLLVYPSLAILGAWLIFQLWDAGAARAREKKGGWLKAGAVVLGGIVLVLTAVWGFAFTSIYTRPMTRIAASRWIYNHIPGPVNLVFSGDAESSQQPLPYPQGYLIKKDQPFLITFTPVKSGYLTDVTFFRIRDMSGVQTSSTLELTLQRTDEGKNLAHGTLTSDFSATTDPRGASYTIHFDQPVFLDQKSDYLLTIQITEGIGRLSLVGSSLVNESDWDDGLPLRVDNYDGFGGIYDGSQNFQMYWDDNAEKLTRFESALDNSDYLLISSNRQWATTTRIPERYPLTTFYYRNVLGCPAEKDILWCYRVAEPGMFTGNLGYELVQVFQSDPAIDGIHFNDQAAEEAFTVYDHPKVFIFKKTSQYDSAKVHQLLESVDLTTIIHVPLKDVPLHIQTLMLPEDRLAQQQAGGTWAELFNMNALQNRYPILGVILWYLTISILGWCMVPVMRLAMPGLPDKGYAFGRISGMLLLALLSWLAGSAGIPVSRGLIAAVFAVLVICGGLAGWIQRKELKEFWAKNKKYILVVEAVVLAFFILDLLIRVGNPDLWHPSKGGEKPMDFSYLNAVIKSTTFPPYDPWMAGGYINYYYYGFVIVGIPVKLLGIEPSIAYNLILPTLFSLLAVGAFSIVWNIMTASHLHSGKAQSDGRFDWTPVWIGIAAAIGIALLGNLGTVRMIWQGFQKLAAPDGQIQGGSLISHWVWALQGLVKFITGSQLPYGRGDWYWIPSRVIPAPNDVEPITEFPFFTFLYADLHAHMMALPVTLLALGWAFSILMGRGRWGEADGRHFKISLAASFLLGGLAIGTLRPTNTWDYPTYLVLGLVAILYTFLHLSPSDAPNHILQRTGLNRWLVTLLAVGALIGISLVLYQPFTAWYGQGYNSIDLWTGTHTPLGSYLTHWGLFIFILVSWMISETIDWMKATPLRSLAKFYPYKNWLILLAVGFLALIVVLSLMGVNIAWLVLFLAVWDLILIFRPGMPDLKRAVCFLVGSGLFFTLMVEVIVLKGDIGRMNTVFKFYLQVWTLFAISSGAALGWILEKIPEWHPGWAKVFTTGAWILAICAALFPMIAGMDKIMDRYVPTASHSLDGLNYMLGAVWGENGKDISLEQDYYGIRWMQQNVKGSPAIVEAHTVEYHWGSRYSINTGLPSVLGWRWHQVQQRAVTPSEWVDQREREIENFYNTSELSDVQVFLRKYQVKYIIVGQLEKALYTSEGIAKFSAQDGKMWKKVFDYKDLAIYEVLPQDLTGMELP